MSGKILFNSLWYNLGWPSLYCNFVFSPVLNCVLLLSVIYRPINHFSLSQSVWRVELLQHPVIQLGLSFSETRLKKPADDNFAKVHNKAKRHTYRIYRVFRKKLRSGANTLRNNIPIILITFAADLLPTLLFI